MPFSLLCPSRRCNYRSQGSFVPGNIVRRERRRQPSAALRRERFTFHPTIVFSPILKLTCLTSPPVLTDTLIAALISRTQPQFLLTIRGGCQEVIGAVRNKVRIAVRFLFLFFFLVSPSLKKTTVPSRRALIGCAAGTAMGEIRAFNGVVLFKEAPSARVTADCQRERNQTPPSQKKSNPSFEKKRKLEQQREEGVVRVTIKAPANGWRGSRRAHSCLLINKALSFRRKTAIISHPAASSLPVSLKVTCRH